MFICSNCTHINRLPEGGTPKDYTCGNCQQRTLRPYNNVGGVIAVSAIGVGFGVILGGPLGSILLGLVTYVIACKVEQI